MGEKMDQHNMPNELTENKKIVDAITSDNRVTEDEFENFMHRVTEVQKIVKKLASTDPEEQKHGQILADKLLEQKDISEDTELTVKVNRTVINKCRPHEDYADPNKMSQEAFMRSVEKDAKERAADRKARNERAETYKRIGNGAFKNNDYEKAVTYYTKAIEQRKDACVLWNNRALSYMQLKLFEKALVDCEWALKVNSSNLKALLNSAKCHRYLSNIPKCKEFIALARNTNPHYKKFIDDFEENVEIEFNSSIE